MPCDRQAIVDVNLRHALYVSKCPPFIVNPQNQDKRAICNQYGIIKIETKALKSLIIHLSEDRNTEKEVPEELLKGRSGTDNC